MILTKEQIEKARNTYCVDYETDNWIDTIDDIESRLKAAMERARIIEEMYDQEYGLEHGGVAKQLNQVQAAYERGLRDAADVKVTCWNMETMKPEGSTPLPEWARNAILALKDRGEK
jgi:hypothetical protein